MHNRSRILPWLVVPAVASALLFAPLAVAQTQPSAHIRPDRPAPASPALAQVTPDDKDVAATQSELIRLLRLSPTLTTVVEHDPSLLSNQDYVSHNNPQLAAFLATHPEVARNPEFYLFSHMDHSDGSPDEELHRAVWPELVQPRHGSDPYEGFVQPFLIFLAFACFLAALIWMIRVFLENRRWGRIFKLQSEVHGKLIEKFGASQDLSQYMETEAGKRFLEAAPIPVEFEPQQRMPNAVARVLTPLQIGVVLVLLGIGLLAIRHVNSEMDIPLLVLGTVVLMPGLGFIISAGVTWVLAARLGLMPPPPAASDATAHPFGNRDQQ